MLKYRLTLGPVMFLALIGALWLDDRLSRTPTPQWLHDLCPSAGPELPPGLAILALGLLIVPLAARELGAIFHAGGVKASRRWMTISAMAGLLVSASVPSRTDPVHAVALVATIGTGLLVGALLWHIREKNLHGATAAAGAAMFAFVYLGLMFGFILAMRREHSAWVVLGVLAVIKASDIGAFFTGKAIGRHKLILWLSPGKTWEGLLGGMVFAGVVAAGGAALAREYLSGSVVAGLSMWHAAAIGVAFAVVGQAGDLLASVFKRDAGIKDSGQTLPGFGGVLDVLDSVLLVAPVAFWRDAGLTPVPGAGSSAIVVVDRRASNGVTLASRSTRREDCMSVTKQLLELFRVDKQLRGLRSRLEAAERFLSQQTVQLADFERQKNLLEGQARQLKATIANEEGEAARLEAKIASIREQMNSAKTAKEYNAFLTELNTFKEQKGQFEEKTLGAMTKLEEIDKTLATIAAQHGERVKIVGQATTDRDQRAHEIKDRVAELSAQRGVLAKNIPARELALLESLIKIRGDEAMAPLGVIDRRSHECNCSSCMMALPVEIVSAILASKLMACPSCKCILYAEDETFAASSGKGGTTRKPKKTKETKEAKAEVAKT